MKILANISVVVFRGGSDPILFNPSMRNPGLSPASSTEAAMTSSYYHKNVLLESKSPDKSLTSRFVSPSRVSPERGIKPAESFGNGLKSRLTEEPRIRHGSGSSALSSSSSSSSLSFTKPIYSSRSRTELDIKRSPSRVLEPEDMKQVGSLESSPKWSRIKEAFEGQDSESNLSKTFSRSTSSLPRPLARQLAVTVVKRTESCDRGSHYRPNVSLRTQDECDKRKTDASASRITLDFLPDRSDSKMRRDVSETRQKRLNADSDLTRSTDSDTRSKKSYLHDDVSVSRSLRSLDIEADRLSSRKTRYSDVDRVLTKTYSRDLYDTKLSRLKSYRSEHSDSEVVIGSRNGVEGKRSALQEARDYRTARQRSTYSSGSDSEAISTRRVLPDMESIHSLKSYLKEIQDSKLNRQKYLRTDSLSKTSLSLNVSITTDRESRRSRTHLPVNSGLDIVSRYSKTGTEIKPRLKERTDYDGKFSRLGKSESDTKLSSLMSSDTDTRLSRSEREGKMLLDKADSDLKTSRLSMLSFETKTSILDGSDVDKVPKQCKSGSDTKTRMLDRSDSDSKVSRLDRTDTTFKNNLVKNSDVVARVTRPNRQSTESQTFVAEKESFLDWETKATQLYLQKLEETKASRLKIKKKMETESAKISESIPEIHISHSNIEDSKPARVDRQSSSRNVEVCSNSKTPALQSPSKTEQFLRQPRIDTKSNCGTVTRPKSAVSPLNEESLSLGKLERGLTFHGTMTSPKGSMKGWKMTSTGSWIKVHVEKEVFGSTIKSKVALLAHQFDHLRSSAGESMAKDLVVFKNGDYNPLKPKVGCQSLDTLCCPMFLSTKALEDGDSVKKKQRSPEKVITSESKKVGLVKQVVQNFEESAQKSCSSSESETSPTSGKYEIIENSSPNVKSDNEKSKKPKPSSPNQQRHPASNDTKQHRRTGSNDLKHQRRSDDKDEKTYSTFAGKSKLPGHCKLTIPPRLSSRNGSSQPTKSQRPAVPPPRKPSDSPKSTNSTDSEGSLLAELEKWLVQKYDQKEPPGRQPNESFLWKKLGPQLSSESDDSVRKSSESGGDEPCLGYYSRPFAHTTNGSDGEEHIYMEASFVRPPTELPNPKSPCDSDEGWVDVDEAELEHIIKESNDDNSEILVRSRPKNVKAQCVRRSWVQSVRDSTANIKEWTQKDYQDITVWETEEGDASSSSSTTSDHLYEALYDVIMPDDNAEPEENIQADSRHSLGSISIDTGINETMSSGTQDESSEPTPEISSEPEPKLKRNWSLTKSDIRLEMMSKSNKVKLRNDSSSDAMEPQSDTEVVTSKKKTLIKFILRQKNNAPAKKRTHKKGATFYVRWSKVDRETRECNNMSEKQADELDGVTVGSDAEGKRFATVRRRPSNPIRRPTTPPPLPPIAGGQVRTHEGTKSLEVLRPSIPTVMTAADKSKSLDSAQILKLESADCDTLRRSYSSSQESCSPSSSSQSSHDAPNGNFFLLPKSRGSVASSLSSHSGSSYIHEDEVASIPKPNSLSLPTTQEEACYLQLRKEQAEALRSPFEEEPLYQFYQKRVKQRATKLQTFLTMDEEQEEKKEDLNLSPVSVSSTSSGIPSAMELLHHDIGNQRTLWCEVPEVRSSGILEQVTMQDRKLQEAMFEVITSEASYLKSLNVLIEHFMECPEFSDDFSLNCVLGRRERHVLFSDVIPVREVSIRLLSDLEQRWQENILISNICDILYEHASKFFSVYVKYCANQVYQDRILKEMKATRPDFISVLQRLESNPMCQGLDMLSFLMLPMQRITRMPLLVDAIFHRLTTESPYYDICKLTLVTLNKVVAECNEAARKMERMEEMLVISRQLDFKDCKSIPLISASRWLVKKGELVRLVSENAGRNRTFGRSSRYTRVPLYLFLFTDLLLVARKKSEDAYVVLDYCPRNLVQVFNLEEAGVPMPGKLPESHRNVFQLTMLQNHEFKTVELILGCPLESDRTRWMEAVTPPVAENPEEKIYEEWDCPQVQCIYPYFAKQPDELTLEESDVVNVFRKMPDGWHEGERLRDGVKGWFPASFTVEIISSHIRARNLRQRYRLLMLSQAYVEEQRRAFLLDKADKSK